MKSLVNGKSLLRGKSLLTALLALAILTGCSSESPKKGAGSSAPAKPAVTPPKYETGRVALQTLNVTATSWAADAQPVRLESVYTKGAPTQEGKAGAWRASFASASQRGIKPYVWSGVTEEGAPERGINAGPEDDFNPRNLSTHPFNIAFLKTDTGEAFKVAQEHGGKKILDKNADTPITYALAWDPRKNELEWHVMYGPSAADSKLTVLVNASTGMFLRVQK
ncbi:MAG: hypothetical protein ACRD24_06105 [Terriglobales bacterium]